MSPSRLPRGFILAFLLSLIFLSPARVWSQVLQRENESLHEAETLIHERKWDESIQVLKLIHSNDKKNLRTINLMGIAFTGRGNLLTANEWFSSALTIDSRFVPALKNLAINEFTLNQIQACQRHLTLAVQLAPNDPVVHLYLGRVAYSRHNFPLAEEHLKRAGPFVEAEPDAASELIDSFLQNSQEPDAIAFLQSLNTSQMPSKSQFRIAFALASAGLYKEARPLFEAILQLNPDSYEASFDVALCYFQLKDYQPAIRRLEQLKEKGRVSAELEDLLADAYEANGQTKEAVDELKSATAIEPNNEGSYIDLADLCVKHDSFDLGMEVLNVGLHYNPSSARLTFARGVLNAMYDHFAEADKDFQAASILDPNENYSYSGIALNHLRSGNLTAAISLLRQRVLSHPDDFMLQYMFGRALMQAGVMVGDHSFNEARAALEKSVKLNPSFHASRVQLGEVYLEEGRIREAVVQLEKGHSLDPTDNAACAHLFVAYRKQGQLEKAQKILSELKELNRKQRSGFQQNTRLVRNDQGTAN